MTTYDPECKAELKTCISKKIEKKTIMWGIGVFFTVCFFAIMGVMGAYDRGVKERRINMEYKITNEARKSVEHLNKYCKKDVFHQADTRLKVLENNVGNIKEDVGELKVSIETLNTRTQQVLRLLEKMEYKNNGQRGNKWEGQRQE